MVDETSGNYDEWKKDPQSLPSKQLHVYKLLEMTKIYRNGVQIGHCQALRRS